MSSAYATEVREAAGERPILSPPSDRRIAGLLAGMLVWLVVLGLILFLTGCEDASKGAAQQSESTQRAGAAPPQADSARLEQLRQRALNAEQFESSIRGQASVRPTPTQGSVALPPPSPAHLVRDKFPERAANGSVDVAAQPVSTFSLDVDTASYAVVRRALMSGRLPPIAAVRIEEMVNYFPYAYPAPSDRTDPFAITTTLVPSPWSAENQLLHIAVRGFDIPRAERPRANVVLLIDVSGSMAPEDRLPLLQKGFRLFVEQLAPEDRVAIVTYAGNAQTLLDSTPGRDKQKLLAAIDGLVASGSTAGGEGLQRAYALAAQHFDKAAVNRVILATDGDFNVGITDPLELERFIVAQRKQGIYLSIFGVGAGNLNDALMQRLAQSGNGNAAYIDSLLEAQKALGEQIASTMFPIADDVKIQVEFNPAQVAAYRLVGYETRMLRREDFNNDRVDAGDIGAGHTVTAIYEITPVGARSGVDPLRYQLAQAPAPAVTPSKEIAFVKLRYKLPGETQSRLMTSAVRPAALGATLADAPEEQRFAIAVAAFAQRLRGDEAVTGFDLARIIELADASRGTDREGYRAEFVRLMKLTASMNQLSQR